MPNNNCLEGIRCPQCGSEEPFRIVVTTTVLMWDDGTDYDKMGGETEWDEESYCECHACGKYGRVKDFRVKENV